MNKNAPHRTALQRYQPQVLRALGGRTNLLELFLLNCSNLTDIAALAGCHGNTWSEAKVFCIVFFIVVHEFVGTDFRIELFIDF